MKILFFPSLNLIPSHKQGLLKLTILYSGPYYGAGSNLSQSPRKGVFLGNGLHTVNSSLGIHRSTENPSKKIASFLPSKELKTGKATRYRRGWLNRQPLLNAARSFQALWEKRGEEVGALERFSRGEQPNLR